MKALGAVALVLFAAVVGGVFFFERPAGRDGESLPALSLPAIGGGTIALSEIPGEVVVVNSWATWCPFCRSEIPDFVALKGEFGERVAVVLVNRRESEETQTRYFSSEGIPANSLILLSDPADEFYAAIGGFAMPETVFADRDGRVVVHKRGPMTLAEMRENARRVLAEE